mgnify:CR=1 FL=1
MTPLHGSRVWAVNVNSNEARPEALLIRNGVGQRGRCLDYFASTVKHLEELGFRESPLHRLLELATAPVQ